MSRLVGLAVSGGLLLGGCVFHPPMEKLPQGEQRQSHTTGAQKTRLDYEVQQQERTPLPLRPFSEVTAGPYTSSKQEAWTLAIVMGAKKGIPMNRALENLIGSCRARETGADRLACEEFVRKTVTEVYWPEGRETILSDDDRGLD
ncbi:MAG: hypothetical protein ACYTAN_14525 [Planctomycetota bacterium]